MRFRAVPREHAPPPQRCRHLQSLQLLSTNVERFRGGLVSKAQRLLYHSTLGLRVMKKNKTKDCLGVAEAGVEFDAPHSAVEAHERSCHSGFRVQGSGFRVQGSGFRVQGSRFRVQAHERSCHPGRGIFAQDRFRQPTRQGGFSSPDHLSHFVAALDRHTHILPRQNLKTSRCTRPRGSGT